MDESLSVRASEVSALVDGLRALGFHSNSYGPAVVIKPYRGASNGYDILFGLRRTYLNDFKTPMKVIYTHVPEIMSRFAESVRETGIHKLPDLHGIHVEADQMDEVDNDIDQIQCLFPPQISLDELVRLSSERKLPCSPIANGVEIYKRNDRDAIIGALTVNNNLWYLSMPNLGKMRVMDGAIIDLIFELESLPQSQSPGQALLEVLMSAYGARRVN